MVLRGRGFWGFVYSEVVVRGGRIGKRKRMDWLDQGWVIVPLGNFFFFIICFKARFESVFLLLWERGFYPFFFTLFTIRMIGGRG